MSFKPVDTKVDFPKEEEEVLKFWQDNDIFKKSISQREGAEDFILYIERYLPASIQFLTYLLKNLSKAFIIL